MSRIPPVPARSEVRDGELEAFDRVYARQNAYGYDERAEVIPGPTPGWEKGNIQPYFGALLNSPLIADGISELGVVHRTRGEYPDGCPHADREWIDIVLAQEMGINGVIYAHVADSVALGVRPVAIRAIRRGQDSDLSERELELAEYVRAFRLETVTPAQYGGLEELLGRRGAVEFTAFVAHLMMTMLLFKAFGIPDMDDEPLDSLIDGIIDGTAELPDSSGHVPSLEPPRR